MHFRLTYDGVLFAHRDGAVLPQRSLHVHDIRRIFHRQLKKLWRDHPVLSNQEYNKSGVVGAQPIQDFIEDGFRWRPLASKTDGLICGVDILMLREGRPGRAIQDVDNRLKTIFDALRKAKGPAELGSGTTSGLRIPVKDEDPFYVVVEDDSLITHVSVTTDNLLEPVPDVKQTDGVRLVLNVTIRPYHVHMDNLAFT